jgi:hypothetical protein
MRGSRWTRKIKSFSTLFEQRLAWAVIDRSRATLHGAEHVPRTGGALLLGERPVGPGEALTLRALVQVCTGRTPRFVVDGRPAIIRRLGPVFDRLGAIRGSSDEAARLLTQGEVVCVVSAAPDEARGAAAEARVPLVAFTTSRGERDGSLDVHLHLSGES